MTVPNESEVKMHASNDDLAKEIISDMINNILVQELSAQDPSEVQIFDNAYTSTPDEQVGAQGRSTADHKSAYTSTPDEQSNTQICHSDKGGSPHPPTIYPSPIPTRGAAVKTKLSKAKPSNLGDYGKIMRVLSYSDSSEVSSPNLMDQVSCNPHGNMDMMSSTTIYSEDQIHN